jgi:hypothetical protein
VLSLLQPSFWMPFFPPGFSFAIVSNSLTVYVST